MAGSVNTLLADIERGLASLLSPVILRGHKGSFGYAEVKRYGANAPCVVFAVDEATQEIYGRSVRFTLSCVCFSITKDSPGNDRMLQVFELVERLGNFLPSTDWGTGETIAAPSNISHRNLYTPELDSLGLTMWGTRWMQLVTLRPAVSVDSLDDFARMFVTNVQARPTEQSSDTDASEQLITLEVLP